MYFLCKSRIDDVDEKKFDENLKLLHKRGKRFSVETIISSK